MIDAIAKRVSCRSFKQDPVPDEAVKELVHAALCAPSAHNARPWHILIVRDPQKRQALSRVHRWAGFCAESPVVIVVAADPSRSDHWWVEDCAAAVENILIQATAMGLGTCWVGVRGSDERGYEREEKVREVCGIPPNIRVAALVAVGWPAVQGQPKGPAPVEAIHGETW